MSPYCIVFIIKIMTLFSVVLIWECSRFGYF